MTLDVGVEERPRSTAPSLDARRRAPRSALERGGEVFEDGIPSAIGTLAIQSTLA